MPLCKIVQEYTNADNWKLGDVVDITNPWTLLKEGKVMLVNNKGNEIPLPDIVLTCSTCIYKTKSVKELILHLFSHLSIQDKIEVTNSMAKPAVEALKEGIKEDNKKIEEVVSPTAVGKAEKPFAEMTPEEKKAWRIENLKKAREAKKNG